MGLGGGHWGGERPPDCLSPIAYRPSSQFKRRGEETSVLCRPGDDLLSRVLRQSTIGAEAFDGRVRDGIGSDRLAKATRPAKDGFEAKLGLGRLGWNVWEHIGLPPFWAASATRARPDGRFLSRLRKQPRGYKDAHWQMRAIKSNERLVPVSYTRCRASTSGLSTWWSSTALQGELVLRLVSRLDAFSGYPFRI